MHTYIQFKNQQQTLTSLSQTLKVVEKIASSQIHLMNKQQQHLIFHLDQLSQTINHLSSYIGTPASALTTAPPTNKHLTILLTGDKGLVGGLYRKVINHALSQDLQHTDVSIAGTKGQSLWAEHTDHPLTQTLPLTPDSQHIQQVRAYILDQWQTLNYASISVIYPFVSSITEHIPKKVQLLPLEPASTDIPSGIPLYNPSATRIFNQLATQYLKTQITFYINSTLFAQAAARTITSEHAVATTDLKTQTIKRLYLKERRRSLTQKQLASITQFKHL